MIEACTHGDFTYTVAQSSHTPVCGWCYAKLQEEEHTYTSSDPACTVCGCHNGMLIVHFVPGIEGAAGSSVELYCQSHTNCVFV